jgi:acetate---CoA ligase (ADP-forming)
MIGPNCMGLLNGAGRADERHLLPDVPRPRPGVDVVAVGGARARGARPRRRLGLGIATFVSVGNKADISGNDLLLYWEDDPDTDVILMYLESFGNPRKFSRIARRISRTNRSSR